MRRFLFVFIAAFSFTVHAAERPDVSTALDAYIEAIESGDAAKVVALYDKNAVFYSMIATKPLKTQAQRLEYYKKVVSQEDLSVDIDEADMEEMGNKATSTGQYTFHHIEEGEEVETPGKFEFKYIWKNGKWLITEHRSMKTEAKKEENDR